MGSEEKMAKVEAVTYVFSIDGEPHKDKAQPDGNKMRLWQIVPSVCASLCCLPYGLMLGWPCPTYPTLVGPDSPIPISYDQSAMIAGFLMIGNALGTPISSKSYVGSRYGILLGILFMIAGWFAMWQARNIYWLLGSRLLVGLGNGFATGQLKLYIADMCDDDLKPLLLKHLNLYVFLGLLAVFSFGPWLDFRQTAVAALLVAVLVFVSCLLLPSSPSELVRANQMERAGRLVARLKPQVCPQTELARLRAAIGPSRDRSLLDLVKQNTLGRRLGTFACLVFFQQWSGAPATIVYTQILFAKSGCPHVAPIAIGYGVLYLASNVAGVFVTPKYDRRTALLCSSCGAVLLIIAKICVVLFDVNETYWSYTSVVVMYLFIVVHTVGLGSVPVTLIPELFPKEYRTAVTHFFIMFHSILALVVTKIFQVLMTTYNVGIGFCLFLSVSVVATVFIYFVVPKKTDQVGNNTFIKGLQ